MAYQSTPDVEDDETSLYRYCNRRQKRSATSREYMAQHEYKKRKRKLNK